MLGLGLGMTARRSALPALIANLPSLDLDFLQQGYSMSLVSKAFGDIISFSRASSATRINSAGLLETVAANVPRFDYEPADIPILGPELVTNGEFSDATGWTLNTGWDVSSGSLNHSAPGVTQPQLSLVTQAGKTYQCSYRIVSQSQAGAGVSFRIGGANLTIRNAPGTYTENYTPAGDGSIVSFIARGASGDWLGSIKNVSVREVTGYTVRKGDPKGLLIEEQRTNLCTYSEDFSQSAWAASACTKTTTSAQDAYGGTKAATITLDTQNQSHFLLGPSGVSFTAGTTYTASMLIKAAGTNKIQLSLPGAAFGVTQYANFSLSGSGSVLASSGLTAKIEPVANGFYRCQITGTATTTAAGNAVVMIFINADNETRLPGFVGNGSDSVTVCFSQVEVGAFATSYIPTTSVQVTRAADVATINTLSPWFSAGNGVLYAEHTTFNPAPAANRVLEVSNGGSQERIYIAQQSATTMRLNSSAAGATVVAITQASPGVGFVAKTASRIKTNDFGLSTNGLDAITDTDAPAPSGLNVIRLGSANFDLAFLNGHIRKVRYYPKNSSNAEIKALTA